MSALYRVITSARVISLHPIPHPIPSFCGVEEWRCMALARPSPRGWVMGYFLLMPWVWKNLICNIWCQQAKAQIEHAFSGRKSEQKDKPGKQTHGDGRIVWWRNWSHFKIWEKLKDLWLGFSWLTCCSPLFPILLIWQADRQHWQTFSLNSSSFTISQSELCGGDEPHLGNH